MKKQKVNLITRNKMKLKNLFGRKEAPAENPYNKIYANVAEDLAKIESEIRAAMVKYHTEGMPIILNHLIFFRVSYLDITGAMNQAQSQTDPHQKNLAYRALCLHLYEFLDDAKDFIGASFRKNLEQFPNREFLLKELNDVKEWLRVLTKRIKPGLADIRHNTIAHKTQNGLELKRRISEINYPIIEEAWLLISVFFMVIKNFNENIINSFEISTQDISCENKSQLISKLPGTLVVTRQLFLLIQGLDLKTAKLLGSMSPEQLNKVKNKIDEVLKYIKNNKSK